MKEKNWMKFLTNFIFSCGIPFNIIFKNQSQHILIFVFQYGLCYKFPSCEN
jgi:hypothetical protein